MDDVYIKGSLFCRSSDVKNYPSQFRSSCLSQSQLHTKFIDTVRSLLVTDKLFSAILDKSIRAQAFWQNLKSQISNPK